MTEVRAVLALAFALLVLARPCSAQSATAPAREAAMCIATASAEPPASAATPELLCRSGSLSLRIDALDAIAWPQKASVKIEHLSPEQRHRVTILCDGRPQQSFRFRFSEFKSNQLCLFMNSLYGTAQLWESQKAPWCKCK